MNDYLDYLEHHGVKGMKWGVRKDRIDMNRSELVTKKGDPIGRVEGYTKADLQSDGRLKKNVGNRSKERHFYNNEKDRDIYIGAYSNFLMKDLGKNFVGERIYKTLDDLVSPNESYRKEIFRDTYKKNKKVFDHDLDYQVASINRHRPNKWLNGLADKYDSTKEKNDEKYVNEVLYPLYTSIYFSSNTKSRSIYNKAVKKRGYNALVDDNNRGLYNNAVQPFISLYSNKKVSEVAVRPISAEEITRRRARVSYRNFELTGDPRVTD